MNNNDEILFKASNISKSFGNIKVLQNISLSLKSGEIALLLGANGSGKSTLLKIFSGLLRADNGEIETLPKVSIEEQFRRVGYVGHAPLLYPILTVRENLEIIAKLLNSKIDLSIHIKEWDLASYADCRVLDLSKGLQARAALARATLSNPKFIFFDEPTSALDDKFAATFVKYLTQYAANGALTLIATHDISRLQTCATRVIVMHDGNISVDKPLEPDTNGFLDALEQYRGLNR